LLVFLWLFYKEFQIWFYWARTLTIEDKEYFSSSYPQKRARARDTHTHTHTHAHTGLKFSFAANAHLIRLFIIAWRSTNFYSFLSILSFPFSVFLFLPVRRDNCRKEAKTKEKESKSRTSSIISWHLLVELLVFVHWKRKETNGGEKIKAREIRSNYI